MEDLLPFDLPTKFSSIIKVLGVGGGGSNAVNHMFRQGIKGVDFIVTNTDIQALSKSPVNTKIQLGKTLTEGLGAGNQPERGREAAIENIEDVKQILGSETRMAFITAGMGGGTGTGGAPVIAQACKEMGILTVGIVTIPFRYEGRKRIESAIEGIAKMEKHVDALLVINNEKIREIYGNLDIREALGKADEVLTVAAKGIAEIITVEGHINVDFADVKTVMKDSGIALMGTGESSGENRAQNAVEEALSSPLLDNTDIKGAKNLLLNIVSGNEGATLDEISYINEYVQNAAGNNADLIWGSNVDKGLGDSIVVTVIATGFGSHDIPELYTSAQFSDTEEKDENQIIRIGEIKQSEDEESFFGDYDLEPKITVRKADKITDYLSEKKADEVNEKPVKKVVSVKNPVHIKTVTKEETHQEKKSNKLTNYLENLTELEDEPAFKRKGIKLKEGNESDISNFSRYTLSGDDDDDISLNENNSYLHDKAD
jgi:cell division protein FtsZ